MFFPLFQYGKITIWKCHISKKIHHSIPRSACCSAQRGSVMSLSATAVKRGSGNVPSTSFSTITGERNAERQSRDTCAWLMPNMSPTSCLFLYVPDESISISFRSSATSSGSDTRLRKYSFVMSFSTKLKTGSLMAAPEMFLSRHSSVTCLCVLLRRQTTIAIENERGSFQPPIGSCVPVRNLPRTNSRRPFSRKCVPPNRIKGSLFSLQSEQRIGESAAIHRDERADLPAAHSPREQLPRETIRKNPKQFGTSRYEKEPDNRLSLLSKICGG